MKKNARNNNTKGFTLIELLAVIVILGVIMAIAIPSMTTYIENSKKDSMISSGEQFISGARTLLLSENNMPGYNQAIVVPISAIDLESGGNSPYTNGDFTAATSYVIVLNTATGNTSTSTYEYYVTLRDSSNNCLQLTQEPVLNGKAKNTRTLVTAGTSCTAPANNAITNATTAFKSTSAATAISSNTITFTAY